MTIPRTPYNPADYGLPSEAEIASLASAWFPEFAASASNASAPLVAAQVRNASYFGELPWSGVYANGVNATHEPASGAYTPVVLPAEAQAASYRGPEISFAALSAIALSAIAPSAIAPSAIAPSAIAPSAIAPSAIAPSAGQPAYRRIGAKSLAAIRADFPILAEKANGRDLVWLDNAATTQKPKAVIDRLKYFYEHENSNIHRGVHELADRSSAAYEEARLKIARFIGAPSVDNIVFVRGTTEGINLAARAYVKQLLKPGDEIILTMLEHHANIVPWQITAQETGALIRAAPIDKSGQIILSEYEKLFNSRTRFVSAAHVSNALGTVAPAAELTQIAHTHGVRILIDGAQAVSHMPVDVAALDADFYVFSGHKIFGPTGIGALYGKSDALEASLPYQGGGNMIADVTLERTLYQNPPAKFEAGTGNIAGAVGLGAALDYVNSIGIENIAAWERELTEYGMNALAGAPGLRLVGTALHKTGVLSFIL